MHIQFKTLSYVVLALCLCQTTVGLTQERPADEGADFVPYSPADLANAVCTRLSIMMAMDRGLYLNGVVTFQIAMLDYLHLPVKSQSHQSAITDLWNSHQDEMICTQEDMKWDYPQHLLKRIVSMDRKLKDNQPFFDYLFDNPEMSVNAVEIRDGKPETLIDYLNGILAAPVDPQRPWNLKEVEILRDDLREYLGAKTAAELSAEAVE